MQGKVRQFGRQVLRLSNQADALAVFTDFLCFAAAEVVQTCTAVCIDIPIGFVFFVEILQDEEKCEMFEHVGVVAGVECVSVTEHGQ